MRAALALALAVAVPGCKKKIDVADLPMIDLVRPPLSMKVPDWEIKEDARDPGLGKYKVQRKGLEFVEVSWQGGEPMSAAELEELARSVLTGYKLEPIDASSSAAGDELRHEVVAKIGTGGKEVWMEMTLIQCTKTNVTVTVGVGTLDEKTTRALSDRVMADFHCVGESPDRFGIDRSPPAASLGDEFGYFDADGTILIVHPDGRAVFVVQAGGDNSAAISKHAGKTLDTFASLMETTITDVSEPRGITGLGGARLSVVDAKNGPDKLPLVAASYYCKKRRLSYTLVAFTENAGVARADLEGVVAAFGCPGAGKPVTERKSACEVGATSFCPQPAPAP